ncbi:MAG: GTP-binding protein [Burkholderiaceae bacterium]
MPAIPIHVLTGFLGAGKSTLLGQAVHEPEMARALVIVNEFGDVGLDHLLVARGNDDTVLLDSGCLCCAGTDLGDTLMLLLARRDRGEIVGFDRVVVETSGLADPGPVLLPILANPFIRRHFSYGGMTAVVDGLLAAQQMAAHAEARRQIALAEHLVVSKLDLCNGDERRRTIDAVRALNPAASLVESPVAGQRATQALGFARDEARAAAPSVSRRPVQCPLIQRPLIQSQLEQPAADETCEHSHGFWSRSFRSIPPVDWERYACWQQALRMMDGQRLARTKGILRFDDGTLRVIQGVRHVFAPPAIYEGPPTDPFLVAICHDLPAARLEQAYRPLLAPGATP